jgi:hypothetical protein
MPIGKKETKEEFYRRLMFDHALKESLFAGELDEWLDNLEDLEDLEALEEEPEEETKEETKEE